jgi:tetracycline repressor-like protein
MVGSPDAARYRRLNEYGTKAQQPRWTRHDRRAPPGTVTCAGARWWAGCLLMARKRPGIRISNFYIAAVVAEDAEGAPAEYEGLEQMADAALTRADRGGPGPILQAIIRSDTSAEIRAAARDLLAPRLAGPLAARMTAQGVDRPQLRAEVAVSALFGISLGRSLGWFDEIRSVPRDELVALIVNALGTITGNGPER